MEPLTPKFIPDEHGQYADAIVKALKDPRIRNIAVSGNYGVGKSSILQRVSELMDGEVVELSLSTLAPIESSTLDDAVPAQATTPTNRIQQEIVKQLLYREEPDNAAGSRFRRIERFNPWRELGLASLAGLVGTLVFLIAGWGTIIAATVRPLADVGLWVYPAIFVAGTGTVFVGRLLLHGRVHVRQFSAGPAAVTLDEKSVSYFDQYLDEIVYFFETTKHRVVIFEDIDRFDDAHIFETLRSLNTLLNASPQIRNRPVRFVYAIKDSIFDRAGLERNGRVADVPTAGLSDPAQAESVRANRTKFFDLVIPVVPFITHRSARNLTAQVMRGSEHRVSDDLIDLAGRFVPDMRLLKNVRNEFVVFRDRIFSGEGARLGLSETDLFAMMLYKSTHLGDFEVIRLGVSNLDRLYEASRALVSENVARIERELRAARREVTRAGSAGGRAPLLGDRLLTRIEAFIRASGSNRMYERFEFAGVAREADFFRTAAFWDALATGGDDALMTWNAHYTNITLSLSRTDIATIVGEMLDPDAWRTVDRDAVATKITELEKQLRFLRKADMGDLLRRPEFLVNFRNEELPLAAVAEALMTRGLGFELVRANFIGRNFTLYTSTFHGDRVSSAATNFIIHHVERGLMDEHFELAAEDVEAVLRERGSDALADPALYNIAILDDLLGRRDPAAEVMVEALASLDSDAVRFLQSYLTSGQHAASLVAQLAALSPRFLAYLVNEVELDDASRIRLVSACLGHLSVDTRQLTDEGVGRYLIDNYPQLPSLTSEESSPAMARRMAEVFRDASVVLPTLGPLHQSTLSAFVELGLYEVTEANLRETLGEDHGLALDEIREASPDQVYARVLGQLPAYLSAISGRANSNEAERGFARVVNDVYGAAPKSVWSVISAASQHSRIVDLASVPEATWEPLAIEGRFPATFANVRRYLDRAGDVDDALAVVLAKDGAISELADVEEVSRQTMAIAIIAASSKLDPGLRAALSRTLRMKNYLGVDNLPAEEGRLFADLISHNVVRGGADTYRHLAGTSWRTRELVLGVSENVGEWVSPEMVGADLGSFLKSSVISKEAKRAVVARADEFIPHGGREGLIEIARQAVETGASVSFRAVRTMAASKIPPELVLALVEPFLPAVSDDELFGVLHSLGGDYAQLAVAGRDKPRIPNSHASRALLAALQSRGIVSTFDPAENPIKVNKHHK